MNRELLAAIQNGKPWLDRFTRPAYPKAFATYTARFAPLYRAAVRDAGEHPETLAADIVDTLARERTGEKFWNRSARAMDEKRMVVCYLSPMLAEQGEGDFAEALRRAWSQRWKRDGYQLATYDKLRRSFHTTVLGFDVGIRDD